MKKSIESRDPKVDAPVERADEVAGRSEKVESEARVEAEVESQQAESRDSVEARGFVVANAKRLGFKLKLNLAIRQAIAILEQDASREAGKDVDAIRSEFLGLQRRRAVGSLERMLPAALLAKDYRAFLVCLIALSREERKLRSYL